VNVPHHHPPEDDLLAYSAGTASEGLSVLVACHLTFCPACRDTVAFLDQLGGALVPDEPTADAALPSLDALLARLADEPAAAAKPRPVPDDVLPAPLRERVGGMADLPWRQLPLGVAHASVDLGDTPAFLYDFPPGLTLPDHHHEGGVERAMPLVGGFSDDRGSYGPGDLCITGEDHCHHVQVDDDGRCVCLFVNDGAIVIDNLALRLLAMIGGLP